jgi:hypothetical protein
MAFKNLINKNIIIPLLFTGLISISLLVSCEKNDRQRQNVSVIPISEPDIPLVPLLVDLIREFTAPENAKTEYRIYKMQKS